MFGINPHAGEDGLFADDDERITKPAVTRLKQKGIAAEGPTGADLLLSQRQHDFYLAMFHDQGHIPIKLISPLRASALARPASAVFQRRPRLRFRHCRQARRRRDGHETVELLAGTS